MEKGVSKYWTPQADESYQRLINSCKTFAERQLIMAICGLIKYDGRTRAARKASAQARLRLAICSDDELKELARLEIILLGDKIAGTVEERLEVLKEMQAKIRERGIKRSDLNASNR